MHEVVLSDIQCTVKSPKIQCIEVHMGHLKAQLIVKVQTVHLAKQVVRLRVRNET
jgi:hypothetical protein